MLRTVAAVCGILALVIVCGGDVSGGAKPKNQMVKGTIKVVDTTRNVLVIKQKLKNELVDRELSIAAETEFVVNGPTGKKEGTGKDGLFLLQGAEGSSVQVKCDKDVNVLRVTVNRKK